MDATQLLKKDHKMVKQLFEEFEKSSGRAAQKKQSLAEQIRHALSVHAQIEEEIFYPALKHVRSHEAKDLVCEATEEHKVAKTLLAEIAELSPDNEQYNAKMTVLCEYVMHHVKEEEGELFKQAKKHLSTRRLEELGSALEARRQELMGEMETSRQAA